MFFLRLFVALAAFGVASAYGVLLALVRSDRTLVPRDYARFMRRVMHPVLGLRVEVQGEANLERARPCVYVVNHQSALDIPILSGLFPPHTVLIAKQELRRVPLFGWLYEVTGNIYIDRTRNSSAVQRLREAEDAIRERGVSVWVFPEGTRGRTAGELLPFKKGAFYMAVHAGVPIVPIVVSPVQQIFDTSRRHMQAGTVQVRVLHPIATEGLEDESVADLVTDVHARMSAALREIRTTPGSPAGQLQLNSG